ncbi:MAG: DUF4833 domain-containing protein [Candidatus Edwardsbacteria bacterium]|nr:DUF4833 domain-containing protein [Candidatus Edwardsbacteria bacterium]
MRKLMIATLALSVLGGLALAQSTQPLFHIERTKNANKLYYEARIGPDGKIDAEDPIKVYWIMWAKDSTGKTTEGMNFIERAKVYGYNINADSTGRIFKMTLKPFKERLIKVYLKDNVARAEMTINCRPAYFEKMFIYAKGDSKPDSIRLSGYDVDGGKEISEMFLPNKK